MNTFQKSQAAKLLAAYITPEELQKSIDDNDIEKAHPVGYINKNGYQKQADGKYKYVGKKKANSSTSESETKTNSVSDSTKKAALAAGMKELDKERLESISRTREKFLKIKNPSESQIAHMDKLEAEEQKIKEGYSKKSEAEAELEHINKELNKLASLDKITVSQATYGAQLIAEKTKVLKRIKEEEGKKPKSSVEDADKQAESKSVKQTKTTEQTKSKNTNPKSAEISKLTSSLDASGIDYKETASGGIAVQKDKSFITIFSRGEGKYIVNTTAGTIEAPSKATNATWYGSTPMTLDEVKQKYLTKSTKKTAIGRGAAKATRL